MSRFIFFTVFALLFSYVRLEEIDQIVEAVVADSGDVEVLTSNSTEKEEKILPPWGETNVVWPPMLVTFINNMDKGAHIWYQTPTRTESDMDFGFIGAHERKSFTTYHGTAWYITDLETKKKLEEVFVVNGDTEYEFLNEKTREERNARLRVEKNEFFAKYKEESDRNWIQIYPRPPPVFFMYEANEVGDVTTVHTRRFKWHKDDPMPPEEVDESKDPISFTVETVSISPRVFLLNDVISDDECDWIIERANDPGRLQRSKVTTESVVSRVRTSSNAWFPTDESPIVLNIFNRIANILQIPEDKLRHDQCAENLQIVYYNETQEYRRHHDYLQPAAFLNSANVQRGNNRFATIIFYLHEPDEGGETFFPRSSEGAGFKVKPNKGSAALFYSMLPDGNLDVNSEHGGLPVLKGEKYISNLWIWEPLWL